MFRNSDIGEKQHHIVRLRSEKYNDVMRKKVCYVRFVPPKLQPFDPLFLLGLVKQRRENLDTKKK